MKFMIWLIIGLAACAAYGQSGETMNPPARTEMATFAGGCFWCIEEIFRQQPGVTQVRSGYIGGTVPHPTYRQVCEGDTGHAEAIQLTFDPQQISYDKLLTVFWTAHDPTQLNRQGADVGTQYRSAIFTHSEAQQVAAQASLRAEDQSGRHTRKIVTVLEPATEFFPAEDYHQEYYLKNKRAPYCQAVIRPKLNKLGLQN